MARMPLMRAWRRVAGASGLVTAAVVAAVACQPVEGDLTPSAVGVTHRRGEVGGVERMCANVPANTPNSRQRCGRIPRAGRTRATGVQTLPVWPGKRSPGPQPVCARLVPQATRPVGTLRDHQAQAVHPGRMAGSTGTGLVSTPASVGWCGQFEVAPDLQDAFDRLGFLVLQTAFRADRRRARRPPGLLGLGRPPVSKRSPSPLAVLRDRLPGQSVGGRRDAVHGVQDGFGHEVPPSFDSRHWA